MVHLPISTESNGCLPMTKNKFTLIETITFEEHDGKTKMTDTAHYQTIEDLDGMLQSGMEEGATETMDQLAELVEKNKEK